MALAKPQALFQSCRQGLDSKHGGAAERTPRTGLGAAGAKLVVAARLERDLGRTVEANLAHRAVVDNLLLLQSRQRHQPRRDDFFLGAQQPHAVERLVVPRVSAANQMYNKRQIERAMRTTCVRQKAPNL